MRFVFFFLIILIIPQSAISSHALGGYIRYENQGGYKYKLIAAVYRDCRGIPLSTPTFGVFSGTNGGNACGSSTLSGFTLVSIKEITPLCATDSAQCKPQNKTSSGLGVEEFTYVKNIDLSQSPFSAYLNKSSCCEISFYMSWSQRTGFSSGCVSGFGPCDNYNTLATLNICNLRKCSDTTNTSAYQKSNPLMNPGCNQALYHSTGFSDFNTFDSLKFNLACPIATLPNSSVSYSSPFSCQYFMTPYCVPPTTIKCTPNPKTSPPRGVFFDTITGDLLTTPTNCNEVFTYVPEVHEYRQDTQGIWREVGRSRRDYAATVNANIGYNKSPEIAAPNIQTICAGDKLCFDINGKDETFTPYQTVPDTVKMWWDTAIRAATFSIKNPKDREKTAQFCWQTHDSDIRSTNYRFTVYVSDQHCSPPVISSKTILIRVAGRAKGKISVKKGPCGSIYFAGKKDSAYTDDANYSWELSDSLGNIRFTSKRSNDTVRYLPEGRYYAKMTINNKAGCGSVLYDTIQLGPLPNVWLGVDTFACYGDSMRLTPQRINFAQKPYTYRWEIQGKQNSADTLRELTLGSITKDTLVVLRMTDSLGCNFLDSQRVFVKPLPQVIAGPDIRICTYETATLQATVKPTGGKFLWPTGDTTSSIQTHLKGKYTVQYTEPEYHCVNSDVAEIFVNDTVKAFAGKDQEFCRIAQTTFSGQHKPAFSAASYYWSGVESGVLLSNKSTLQIADTNAIPSGATLKRQFELLVYVSDFGHLCVAKDTVQLKIHSIPAVAWTQNNTLKRCHSESKFILEPFIAKPDSADWTSGFFRIYSLSPAKKSLDSVAPNVHFFRGDKLTESDLGGGKYYSEKLAVWAQSTQGCVNTDTLEIQVIPNPYITLDTSIYCQNMGPQKLDVSVQRPKTKFGTKQSWKILSAPAGVDTSGIVVDNSSFGTDWEIRFGPAGNNAYAGDYKVLFHVTDILSGCASEDSTLITAYPTPVLTPTNIDPVCENMSPHELRNMFMVDGKKPSADHTQYSIYSYNSKLNPNDFGNARIESHYFFSDKPGMWQFALENEENGCASLDTFALEVATSPKASFNTTPTDTASIDNPVFQLNNTSTIATGEPLSAVWKFEYPSPWNSGNIYSPTVFYPKKDSQYTIQLIVFGNWCSDTAQNNVVVGKGHWTSQATLTKQNSTIALNNRFQLNTSEYGKIEIHVYNAAGQEVGNSHDNEGIDLPPGLYYYHIQLQKDREKPAVFRGTHLVQSL